MGRLTGDSRKAKQEFLAISKAESLKPLIFRAVPNYRAMLFDLISEVEKSNEMHPLPSSLMQKVAAMRTRLGTDEASFGISPEQDVRPYQATQHLHAQNTGRHCRQPIPANGVSPREDIGDKHELHD